MKQGGIYHQGQVSDDEGIHQYKLDTLAHEICLCHGSNPSRNEWRTTMIDFVDFNQPERVFFMRRNNPNSTVNLLKRLEDDWDDKEYNELMRIEDILENRKRLKIIKKYGRTIFEKAKKEFDGFMHWQIAEVNATPPTPIPKSRRTGWNNDFVPRKSENVKGLTLVDDSHYSSYCDSSNGTIYIKTKKGYFSIYFHD